MMPQKTKQIGESLSIKATSSAFWIFLFQGADNVLGFLRLLILARLLSPKDFGLVGIAWLILQIVDTFTQTGVQQALIHKPKIKNFLNTAWTYLAIRGIIIFVIVYLAAPILGDFFSSLGSVAIIRAIALTVLLNGFVNIGTVYFQKHLTFNKQFIFQISGSVIDFIVAVTLALIFKNVWAIVYGAIANSAIKVIISYILSDFRPKLEFQWSRFKEINNYGKWIAGSSILQFIYSQGDDILVGKVLGATSLGFYQLAYKISNLPATQVTHLISSVMFPAYSTIQNDKKRISKIYLQVLQIVTFLSFFVGVMIILFTRDFTILFLGEKWLPMISAMQILTIWGILRSISSTTGPVWQSQGEPKTMTYLQLLQVIILLVIIIPLTLSFNIVGTSLAVVISLLFSTIVAIYLISKTLVISLHTIMINILFPFAAGVMVVLAYLFLKHFASDSSSLIIFIIEAVLCVVVYLGSTVLLSKFFKYRVYKDLLQLSIAYSPKFKQRACIIEKIVS